MPTGRRTLRQRQPRAEMAQWRRTVAIGLCDAVHHGPNRSRGRRNNQPGPSGTVPYWTVSDVDATVARWSEHGASAHRGPKTIMTGERLCQVLDPFGNLFGLRQPPA